MKLTIDNNQKVFLIQSFGWSQKDIFCNLSDIPNVLNNVFEKGDEIKISLYFNRKFKRVSKKQLNEFFVSNQIDYKI